MDPNAPGNGTASPRNGPRLESWKEIANYLGRTVRTVQRWEREQGLPVHRLQHIKQSTVFAYVAEIDQWWDERRVTLEAERADGPDLEHEANGAGTLSHGADVRGSGKPWSRIALWALSVGVAIAAFVWFSSAYTASAAAAHSQRLYQEGRDLWKQRTPDAFRQAIARFEQSIASDPANARAHAGLADSYTLLDAFGVEPAGAVLPRAHAAATRAIELAPSLGEAHASLAMVHWQQNHRAEAMRVMERALALDPQYATARHWYALFLQDSGRYQDAVREGKAARALDPTSPVIGSDLAIMLRNAGEPAQARALLEDLVLAHPTFGGHRHELSEAYRREGRYAHALEQMNFAVELGDNRPPTLARLAFLQAKNGIVRGALDTARRLRTMNDQGQYVAPVVLVEALAAAGDLDSAFRLIADGAAREASWIGEVESGRNAEASEVFEAVRHDPRWKTYEPIARAIVARVVKDTVESRPAPEAR